MFIGNAGMMGVGSGLLLREARETVIIKKSITRDQKKRANFYG
jgi:hypothetical protein